MKVPTVVFVLCFWVRAEDVVLLRPSFSAAGGMRMIEGANINRSLLALGNCITALSSAVAFVPYRAFAWSHNSSLPMLKQTCWAEPQILWYLIFNRFFAGRQGYSHDPCFSLLGDSKMTRLLKDSLGGNCRTVMTLGIFLTNFLTTLLTFISTFHFMLWSLLRTEARRVLQPHTSAGTEH